MTGAWAKRTPGSGPRNPPLRSARWRNPAPKERGATWAEVDAALRADRVHWAWRGYAWPRLRRGYHAVALHRFSRMAHERGWRIAAAVLWLVNGWWTGANLPPTSRIGAGLFLPCPSGVVIDGVVGRGAAVGRQSVIGSLPKGLEHDMGGRPGLPSLGDGVTIDGRALVLGPVKVGDRVRIRTGSVVWRDVGAGEMVTPAA